MKYGNLHGSESLGCVHPDMGIYLPFYVFCNCSAVHRITGTQWNCRKWYIPIV